MGRLVYLSAAMSGKPDFNKAEMCRVSKMLRSVGFNVHNPAEYDQWPMFCMARSLGNIPKDVIHNDEKLYNDFWRFCLTNDLKDLMSGRFNLLVVLPEWEASKGVLLELVNVSVLMGMKTYEFHEVGEAFSLEEVDMNIDVVAEATGESLEFSK